MPECNHRNEPKCGLWYLFMRQFSFKNSNTVLIVSKYKGNSNYFSPIFCFKSLIFIVGSLVTIQRQQWEGSRYGYTTAQTSESSQMVGDGIGIW